MKKPLPSQARLRELLDYDPLSGGLVRIANSRRSDLIGKPAGSNHLYSKVSVDQKIYAAHRIIWMWMTGEDPGELEIDHIDRNRHNNRWENLRLATVSQNRINCGNKSRSGLPKGVKKNKGRFGARLTVDGVVHWLGTFDTPEEAHRAYCAASTGLHGEFAAV